MINENLGKMMWGKTMMGELQEQYPEREKRAGLQRGGRMARRSVPEGISPEDWRNEENLH